MILLRRRVRSLCLLVGPPILYMEHCIACNIEYGLSAQALYAHCITARIVRFLAAISVVKEVGQGIFTPTSFSAALVSSTPLSAALIHR